MDYWEKLLELKDNLDWFKIASIVIGYVATILLALLIAWYSFFREKLKLIAGDSDDILFQYHIFRPNGDGTETLLIRTAVASSTVYKMYDNGPARKALKNFADETSFSDMIVPTRGTVGFELLNDALTHAAGMLSMSNFPRRKWLFCMTCEDRRIVRKKCVRNLMTLEADLQKCLNVKWIMSSLKVERPWHWFRVVALILIARAYEKQEADFAEIDAREQPLVDDHIRHRRIMPVSVGLCYEDLPMSEPILPDWKSHIAEMQNNGVVIDFDINDEDEDATGSDIS